MMNCMERDEPQLGVEMGRPVRTEPTIQQGQRVDGLQARTDFSTERRLQLDLLWRDGLELDLPLKPSSIRRQRSQPALDDIDCVECIGHARLKERHPHAPVVAQQRQRRVLDHVEQEPVVVEDMSEVLADRRSRYDV